MRPSIALTLVLLISGCTEPGEMTGVGAATGGAIGAGLGAIIGSQTGDAGSGLVIGAAMGAASGAAVGNALQAQDEAIRSQDEAIERQQEMLAANQRQISELKRAQDPASSYPSYSRHDRVISTYPERNTETSPRASLLRNEASRSNLKERNLPPAPSTERVAAPKSPAIVSSTTSKSTLVEKDLSAPASTSSNVSEVAALPPSSSKAIGGATLSECQKAADEVSKGEASKEIADRLFHYRRALRLCPDNAEYHNLLGQTYVSLNRTVDAEFEFREALKINPDLEVARNNLNALK